MHFDQIVTFIRTVPVFYSLESEHLERLARETAVRDFGSGDELLTRGEESSELFIMVQGEAIAEATEDKIRFQRELRRFYPGDYFGMTNVLARERSAVTVRAIEPTKTLVITRETIDRLFEESTSFGRAVCRSLAGFLRENIIRIPAIPFERLESFSDLDQTSKLLPARIANYCQAIALAQDDDRVKVGMVNPGDKRCCDFIKDVLNRFQVEFVAISLEDFQRHAPKLLGSDVANLSSEGQLGELTFVDSNGQQAPIAETDEQDVLAKALAAAIRSGVSDIHVEPGRDGNGRIRFRLDGKMIPFRDDISTGSLRQLISRLKVMADMDITNTRRPQDGRFVVVADDRTVEFRASVMPCQGGEKTVLRLIAPDKAHSLDSLFVSEAVAHFARDMFQQPSGLVLVTGPTGCGKTTTLYAALQMLNANDQTRNIVTVEDPVEYGLDFATQTQVDEHVGRSFATVLRSILRQDPDVILIGEIRDRESAAIAVEAATTGHLVLSSLHTHSAMETLARLRNLEIPSYMLADALKGVVSQKLLPRIHPAFSQQVGMDDSAVGRLQARGILAHDVGNLQRGVEKQGGPPSGESGRVGMFEFLSMTGDLSDLVERGAPRAEIEQKLTDATHFSFEKYARLLLEGGHVAPEQVERALPKNPNLQIA